MSSVLLRPEFETLSKEMQAKIKHFIDLCVAGYTNGTEFDFMVATKLKKCLDQFLNTVGESVSALALNKEIEEQTFNKAVYALYLQLLNDLSETLRTSRRHATMLFSMHTVVVVFKQNMSGVFVDVYFKHWRCFQNAMDAVAFIEKKMDANDLYGKLQVVKVIEDSKEIKRRILSHGTRFEFIQAVPSDKDINTPPSQQDWDKLWAKIKL